MKEEIKWHSKKSKAMRGGGAGGIWFLGFIGTLVYYLHFHSGTFWLVILAFVKALFWPGFLVYYLLRFMKI